MTIRKITALLVASTALAACQNMGGDMTETDSTALLKSMEGPEVSGVDATMLKMAQSAELQGDYRAAAQTYRQLMDKNSKNVPLGISYAEALRRSGKADDALEIYNKILKVEPDNQDALEGKGLSELSLADLDAASKTLTRLAEINPNRWRALNAIGILFATRGLYEESLQYFDTALQKKPNHPAIINNKGLVQALDRQFPKAISSLLEASESTKLPRYKTQADLNAALVYAIAGDLPNAEVMAAKHLDGPALQNNLGLYALLAKDNDLARTHLHMALSESTVFYEKAWDNLNNIQSGKKELTGKDKSKRIQLSTTPAAIKTLPDLPQPGSASSGSGSETNPQLFENQAPAMNFKAATDEVAQPEAPAPAEKTDAALSTPASNTAPVAAEKEASTDAKSNLNITAEPAEETKTGASEDTQKIVLPALDFDFLSHFKASDAPKNAEDKEGSKDGDGNNVNINAAGTSDDAASTSTDETPAADAGPKEEPKKSDEPSKTDSKKTDEVKTESEPEPKDSKDSASENTPGGVSEENAESGSGDSKSSPETNSEMQSDPAMQQNGFESLEDYIKNW